MPLWKFTKGPYKGKVALAVDNEEVLALDGFGQPLILTTLYVNGKTVSFSTEALKQIAECLEVAEGSELSTLIITGSTE